MAVPLNSSKSGVVGIVKTHKISLEEHQPQCLSFWYMHNGDSNKDSLSVYVKHGLDVFPSAIWKEKSECLEWNLIWLIFPNCMCIFYFDLISLFFIL